MTTHVITVIGYIAIFVAIAALETVARLRPGARVPSVEECLGYLMRTRTGRVLVLLGWWWAGWHFFAR